MSATLDSHLFAQYFGDCPVLTAEGRTFPVTHMYLEVPSFPILDPLVFAAPSSSAKSPLHRWLVFKQTFLRRHLWDLSDKVLC